MVKKYDKIYMKDEISLKKVLAIASVGGHWIQLLRLKNALIDTEVIFMSTKESFASMVPNYKFYAVTDSNRWNKLKLIQTFFEVFRIILKERPQVIITTGAAPGLMGIIIGRFLGCRTIWVDSIANVETLSMSGKIAKKFATRVYTQWPDLAKSDIHFYGNVLS